MSVSQCIFSSMYVGGGNISMSKPHLEDMVEATDQNYACDPHHLRNSVEVYQRST